MLFLKLSDIVFFISGIFIISVISVLTTLSPMEFRVFFILHFQFMLMLQMQAFYSHLIAKNNALDEQIVESEKPFNSWYICRCCANIADIIDTERDRLIKTIEAYTTVKAEKR